MKIVIANDHAAVELKILLSDWMLKQGHEVMNLGVETGEKAHYPLMAQKAVNEFNRISCDYGVLCCGTGIGISIAANKVPRIRCALPQNVFAAKLAREHNNCQFIAFGSWISYPEKTTDILAAFLASDFSSGRHEKRVKMISDMEASGNYNEA